MSGSKAGRFGLQVGQLASMAELFPYAIGYRVMGAGHLTFGQWEHRSNRLARGLSAAGVGRGDRVAIWLSADSALRWVIAYAAIHKAGAAVVPLDPRLALPEVASMLAHAGAVALVADDERVESALSIGAGDSEPPATLTLVVDASVDPGTRAAAWSPDAEGAGPRCRSWVDVLDDDGTSYQVAVDEENLSDTLFPSGTTGPPRGGAGRHPNASAVPNSVPSWGGSLWLHASPLATFAGVSFVYSPMKLGMTSVYQPHFDPGQWLGFVETEAPLAVFLVPAIDRKSVV